MTYTEKKKLSLGVGDNITHYDNGKDGYPKKWVNGIVTEIGEESFAVQWEDLSEQTDYEWQKVTIKGDQVIESGFDNKRI